MEAVWNCEALIRSSLPTTLSRGHKGWHPWVIRGAPFQLLRFVEQIKHSLLWDGPLPVTSRTAANGSPGSAPRPSLNMSANEALVQKNHARWQSALLSEFNAGQDESTRNGLARGGEGMWRRVVWWRLTDVSEQPLSAPPVCESCACLPHDRRFEKS
jgi:hypothetical protein